MLARSSCIFWSNIVVVSKDCLYSVNYNSVDEVVFGRLELTIPLQSLIMAAKAHRANPGIPGTCIRYSMTQRLSRSYFRDYCRFRPLGRRVTNYLLYYQRRMTQEFALYLQNTGSFFETQNRVAEAWFVKFVNIER